jgi:hypothetical protein
MSSAHGWTEPAVVRLSVWIGGAPGAGKTTVGRALARRHGLRLYGADTRTWVHRDRALAAGNDAARRWEELGPAERWERPTDELVEMSLHRHRGDMVLDDLRALPAVPLVVAEGTTLPAHAADPARAVWLLPTPEFQLDQLRRRATPEGHARLYTALREVIAAEAERHGLRTVTIDGRTGPAETVSAVEAMLAGPLHHGPHARSRPERQALVREQNLATIEQVRGFFGRPWATGDPDQQVVSLVCECGDPACTAQIPVRVGDYRSPCLAER